MCGPKTPRFSLGRLGSVCSPRRHDKNLNKKCDAHLAFVSCLLMAGQILFHFFFAACTWHAFRQGGWHVLVWAATLAGGACVELLTIMETEIGNFYHSTPVVTLFGGREPLYMLLGCYVWFQFVSVLLPDGMGLRACSHAAMATLLGVHLWGVLDQVGLKFLWWTWHQSEPLYTDRVDGVPIASSFWSGSSMLCLCYLLLMVRQSVAGLSRPPLLLFGLALGPLATMALMNIPFLVLFHPFVTFGGHSALVPYLVLKALCAGLVAFELLRAWFQQRLSLSLHGCQPGLLFSALLFLAVAGVFPYVFAPETVVRRSYGQPFGDCEAKEFSFWGAFTRGAHVCVNNTVPHRDHFDFSCAAAIMDSTAAQSDYYTICGVPATPEWFSHFHVQVVVCTFLLMVASFVRISQQPVKLKAP